MPFGGTYHSSSRNEPSCFTVIFSTQLWAKKDLHTVFEKQMILFFWNLFQPVRFVPFFNRDAPRGANSSEETIGDTYSPLVRNKGKQPSFRTPPLLTARPSGSLAIKAMDESNRIF